MNDLSIDNPRTKTAIWRGVKGECPKCGDAKLFRAYLKQVDECPSCGHDWINVHADDGPAWATMLIVGHLLAPFFHFLIFKSSLPNWAPATILCVLAIVLCLTILPRTKGGFIGLIWAKDVPTS